MYCYFQLVYNCQCSIIKLSTLKAILDGFASSTMYSSECLLVLDDKNESSKLQAMEFLALLLTTFIELQNPQILVPKSRILRVEQRT